MGSNVDPVRDPVRRKPNSDKGLKWVKARPSSDPHCTPGPDAVGAHHSADRSSVPPTRVNENEVGQLGQYYIGTQFVDPVRLEAEDLDLRGLCAIGRGVPGIDRAALLSLSSSAVLAVDRI